MPGIWSQGPKVTILKTVLLCPPPPPPLPSSSSPYYLLLGARLEPIRAQKLVLMLAAELITRIECLHNKNYVNQDGIPVFLRKCKQLDI